MELKGSARRGSSAGKKKEGGGKAVGIFGGKEEDGSRGKRIFLDERQARGGKGRGYLAGEKRGGGWEGKGNLPLITAPEKEMSSDSITSRPKAVAKSRVQASHNPSRSCSKKQLPCRQSCALFFQTASFFLLAD